ncbi:MAG: hypothetical protein JRM79_04535 [Nitrososphaerota archaeon]|nr:hypothetical protein [Nitrososphaerota archaeon]MDG6912691.1 hypothetical protein [Nitrososphaerota archaeon]MDG6937004.1 hypothetical protein [Nitrososphaerota archaeon]MDG6952151.1 hypothetical protein [Nitrososphaerota archaeon]MDG6958894.1 hypothetical protein [Nitrososphaerota archaeon]
MERVTARAYLCEGMDPDEAKGALARANPGAVVQTVKAGSVKNEFLAEMVAAQTLQAMESGGLLAKKPEIDLLLRLAGTTQISRAIRLEGSVNGGRFLVIVAGHMALTSPPGFTGAQLPRRLLSRSELARVEGAALLGAERS